MATSILATKLFIPPQRPTTVSRKHLIDRLRAGVRGKLTLVSAPAGFGKTTLVSDWLTDSSYQPAWLSLDASDHDPSRFLVYVISALQTVLLDIGASLLDSLQSPQSLAPDIAVTTLINEILNATTDPLILVLDDYHLLDSREIDTMIEFLLDHQPPQLHLVIITREDPLFSLARLRARGELTEVRIADLRFTLDETTQFLNQSMNLNLSADDITSLEARTEGWIAGLQMVALSMQGRQDIPAFIESFTGSHRFILDYLVEEVLESQADHIREFLFQTSILDRLTAPLCDSLTGRDDAQDILETLERGNMLILPLDDDRRWYRYHHLFADVLLAHATQHLPDQVPIWHQRASEWYEQNNFKAEAIRYAFSADDYTRAADLLEKAWPAVFNGFKPTVWRGWVQSLPDEMIRKRPVISTGYAWTLLDDGLTDEVETRLDDAERLLTADDERIVVNHEQFESLPATIAGGRAYLSQVQGDIQETIKHAQHALQLLPEHDHYNRGITAMFLGMGHWADGNLSSASETMIACVESLRNADHVHYLILAIVILGDIQMALGHLHRARTTYQQALDIARSQAVGIDGTIGDQPNQVVPGNINLYVGFAELHRQRGDLTTASDYMETGITLSQQTAFKSSIYRLSVVMARIKLAQGDLTEALTLLEKAEREFTPGPMPAGQPIDALRVHVWLSQGRLEDALRWIDARGLSVADVPTYQTEFEYMTVARVLIALYADRSDDSAIQDAMTLLYRLLQLAEDEARTGSIIESLILQAIAHQAKGEETAAHEILERAITLAEPEGFVQVFLDAGAPIQSLLSICLSHGVQPDFVTMLLQAMADSSDNDPSEVDPNQLLIEPLSNRELDVLELMAQGHTNKAIADELVIAVSTVKKHVNNIFGKLTVSSRTQAVTRARDLNIL